MLGWLLRNKWSANNLAVIDVSLLFLCLHSRLRLYRRPPRTCLANEGNERAGELRRDGNERIAVTFGSLSFTVV
jgi:hypothetical protein